jgi:hypothetical protein
MEDSFILYNIDNIKFTKGMKYSEFLVQFQNNSKKLLCLINYEILFYYEKKEDIPKNIKLYNIDNNIYTFLDVDNITTYTIFTHKAASIFYPNIDIEMNNKKNSSEPKKNKKLSIIERVSTTDNNYIIYDNGKKYIFPYINRKLHINHGTLFQ